MEKARRALMANTLSLTRAAALSLSPFATALPMSRMVSIAFKMRGWYRSKERRADTAVWSAKDTVGVNIRAAAGTIHRKARRPIHDGGDDVDVADIDDDDDGDDVEVGGVVVMQTRATRCTSMGYGVTAEFVVA